MTARVTRWYDKDLTRAGPDTPACHGAVREADRAEAQRWSVGMEGYGGPAQPSPTMGNASWPGWRWSASCETRASLPLNAIRPSRETPIWKLEAALKCR